MTELTLVVTQCCDGVSAVYDCLLLTILYSLCTCVLAGKCNTNRFNIIRMYSKVAQLQILAYD